MKTRTSYRNPFARFFLGLFALGLLSLTACSEEEIPATSNDLTQEVAQAAAEAEFEAAQEDVTEITFEVMDLTDPVNERRHFPREDRLITECATISHDSAAKTIVVDFGLPEDSCRNRRGQLVSGKVIIQYTRRLYIPGASLTVSLQDYVVEGRGVEGTRTITNVSDGFRDHISLNTTLTDGKVTFLDGTFATKSYDRTRTWIRTANPLNDRFLIEGSMMGTNREGESRRMSTLAPLVYKRRCRQQGIRIPVQGLKRIQRDGKPDILVDYGDGECDFLITVTRDGRSRVIDVREHRIR